MDLKLAFLLWCFAALAAANTIPFNNVQFLNDTLFREAIDHLDGTPEGWADAVSTYGNPAHVWPWGPDKKTRIKYCYESDDVKMKAIDDIYYGWKLWHDAIGDPTPANKHSLTFEEFTFNGEAQFCRDHKGIWNTRVSGETVEIRLDNRPGYLAFATVGYLPIFWNLNNGRHSIVIDTGAALSPRPEVNAAGIAHEIGHIFGLYHEHARKDRDHYVRFECKNLARYEYVKGRVEADGRHNMTEVCASVFLGAYWGFPAYEYSMEPWWDRSKPNGNEHPQVIHADRHYDVGSIMHYDSGSDDLGRAVLTQWRFGNIDYEPPNTPPSYYDSNIIPPNTKISNFDVQAIITLYPYHG